MTLAQWLRNPGTPAMGKAVSVHWDSHETFEKARDAVIAKLAEALASPEPGRRGCRWIAVEDADS